MALSPDAIPNVHTTPFHAFEVSLAGVGVWTGFLYPNEILFFSFFRGRQRMKDKSGARRSCKAPLVALRRARSICCLSTEGLALYLFVSSIGVVVAAVNRRVGCGKVTVVSGFSELSLPFARRTAAGDACPDCRGGGLGVGDEAKKAGCTPVFPVGGDAVEGPPSLVSRLAFPSIAPICKHFGEQNISKH